MRNLAARRLSWTSENGLFGVVAPWDCLRLRSSTTAVLSHRFRCRWPLACRGPRPPPCLANPPAPCPSVDSSPPCPPPIQTVEHIHPKPKTHLKLPHRAIEAIRRRSGMGAKYSPTVGERWALGLGACERWPMAHGAGAYDDSSGGDARCQALRWRNRDRRTRDLWGAWHSLMACARKRQSGSAAWHRGQFRIFFSY